MNKGWTSRERVRTTLDHSEPDRIPIAMPMTVAAYKKLRQYLGFPPVDPIQSIDSEEARLDADVAGFLGVDLARVRLHSLPGKLQSPDEVFYNSWHVRRRLKEVEPGVFTLQTVESPLAQARLEDLRTFPWPDPHDPAWIDGVEEEALQLFTETDLALVGRFGGSILDTASDLRGEAQWNEDLEENPDFACALLNRIAALQIELDEAGLAVAGKYLSIMEIDEPATSCSGKSDLYFSGDIWRRTILPVLERRWKAVHLAFKRYAAQARLMFSSSFPPLVLFQDMIESGVQLFGLLQPEISETSFAAIKRDFGSLLCFYGGVDACNLLSRGNENEVRKHVRACLEQLGAGGGFVLAPSQVVQANILPQNIVAMCETAKVYGRYSKG